VRAKQANAGGERTFLGGARLAIARVALAAKLPPREPGRRDHGVTRREPDADLLRAALLLAPFDGRAAQRTLEPLDRGGPPSVGADGPLRPGAALLYAFPSAEGLVFPLTLRRDDLAEHRGQVSLPGGRPEPGEDLWSAALREAREEVGLAVPRPERLGDLHPVTIPVTHSALHVFVALGPDPGPLVPEPREVAQLVLARVADLLDPAARASVTRRVRGRDVLVPALRLGGLEVWGATAMALGELAVRLGAVLARA
jgi:8-oxo-dGTP pyrophosphatase MutT (NUDIX family)